MTGAASYEGLLDATSGDDPEAQLAMRVHETIVQDLAVTKRLLEEGKVEEAMGTLDEAMADAQSLVAERLEPGPGLAEVQAPEPASGPHEVVLVEDNSGVRALQRTLLEEEGPFDVVGEAEDGTEALDVVAETQPDLVVLDLAMPREDGLNVLPALKDISPGTPVAVLSGFAEDALADKAQQAGADLYLEKGLEGDALVAELCQLVGV